MNRNYHASVPTITLATMILGTVGLARPPKTTFGIPDVYLTSIVPQHYGYER
jgi:hypothetical protein